jgi:hypothetical protein
MTEVVMSIIHIAVPSGAVVMKSWAHIHVMSLAAAQEAVTPFGALLIDVVSAILLALTTIKSSLTLTLPSV